MIPLDELTTLGNVKLKEFSTFDKTVAVTRGETFNADSVAIVNNGRCFRTRKYELSSHWQGHQIPEGCQYKKRGQFNNIEIQSAANFSQERFKRS